MQANINNHRILDLRKKPITHSMGWDRFVSYPVCLKACLREVPVMGEEKS